jgi:hypothetical protein
MKVHNNFNASRLARWTSNDVNGILPPPPEPEIVDGEEHYEVESILDSQLSRGALQYRIRWKGYGEAHDSWEGAEGIKAKRLINKFHKDHPDAPR